MESIASTLGAGSGINLPKLIDDLVAADRATRTRQLTARQSANTARVSIVSQARSGLDAFVNAVAQLTASGRLVAAASVSDGTIVGAAVIGTGATGSSTIEVRAIAQAQTVASPIVADPSASIGLGTLALTFGTMTVAAGVPTGFVAGPVNQLVSVGPSNDSLYGLRDAINALAGPVAASVTRDGAGYRLVMKGATGTSGAFTVAATEAGGAGLARFGLTVLDPRLTLATAASDAELVVDGVVTRRSTNSVGDAVAGMRLDLRRSAPGTPVSVSGAVDVEAAKAALRDFVAAFNEVQSLAAAGAEPALRAVRDGLRGLAKLKPAGFSLADLGVRTERTGALAVNDLALAATLGRSPEAIAGVFVGSTGISAGLSRLRSQLTGTVGALTVASTRAAREQSALVAETVRLDSRSSLLRDSLTRRYADADAAVAAYKATANFLTQQTDAWAAARR